MMVMMMMEEQIWHVFHKFHEVELEKFTIVYLSKKVA